MVSSLFSASSCVAILVLSGACHAPSGAQPSSIAETNKLLAPANSAPPIALDAPVISSGGGGAGPAPSGSASEIASSGGSSSGAGSVPIDASTGNAASSGLVDDRGEALPQTEQQPATDSAAFRQRIERVAAAIIEGDSSLALTAFFPLVAYQQVKDTAKPERDYKFRLLANFKRDVLEYHRALGAEATQAKFVGVSVAEKSARWMVPGSEGNKVGYFRVLRSRLRFALPAGRFRDFELTSLISWRGEWYLVHLHGFK